jgi:hypothetical protein
LSSVDLTAELTQLALSWSWLDVTIGLAVFMVTFFGSVAMVALVLVRLPSDYFMPGARQPFMHRWPWPVRWFGLIAKNGLGVLVVTIGVILSLPGMPGQGLLMALIGLMLLDIPGKRAIAHRIVRKPKIITNINRLRARYQKLPIIVS